jgi:predicted chitinase
MRNARENWQCELTRIRKLQWWDEVKGHVTGFPASPVVNHIHPVALVGNFYQKSRLTVEMLRKIWPDEEVPTERLRGIAEEINANMERYSLDSELRLSHFFAQVMQEAGPKCVLDEDLRYYSPVRLKALFRYFRENPSEADSYGYHPPAPANASAIANRAYANRNGNGQVATGDGWKYRGRGLKQTTGKGNYTSFNRDYRNYWPDDPQDFVTNPDLLSETKYGTRSGVYFWIAHSLFTIADQATTANAREKVDAITAIINKGTDSYGQRRDNFKKIIDARIFYGVTK